MEEVLQTRYDEGVEVGQRSCASVERPARWVVQMAVMFPRWVAQMAVMFPRWVAQMAVMFPLLFLLQARSKVGLPVLQ